MNIGKYNILHIWDRVLFTIPQFKIKNQHEYQESQVTNNILVPSASEKEVLWRKHFLRDITPRRIVEENIPGRSDEGILWGRQKFFNQSKLLCHPRHI